MILQFALKSGIPGSGAAIVIGSIALVAFGVLIWAVAFRKPDDERRHRKHHWRRKSSRRDSRSEESESSGSDRRRRKRRKHRPANPTLAETGGLPPRREDTPQPPTS